MLLGPGLICALFSVAALDAPASPAEYHAVYQASRFEPVLAGVHVPSSTEDTSSQPAQPASRWERLGAWLTPPAAWHGVIWYHARTRPGAEARYWSASFTDFWLAVNNPGCRLLRMTLAARPALSVLEFRVLTEKPVDGPESSPFGYRKHPITRRRKLHKGMDLKASRGTPVYAAGPGRIAFAGRRGTYGNLVVISHGLGLETRYAHLQGVRTDVDRIVAAGQLIGTVGTTGRSTGPHLHYEVRRFGVPLDPRWALGLARPSLVDTLHTVWRWVTP